MIDQIFVENLEFFIHTCIYDAAAVLSRLERGIQSATGARVLHI